MSTFRRLSAVPHRSIVARSTEDANPRAPQANPMRLLRWIAANCAVLAALVVIAAPAQSATPAAAPAPGVNETCLMCHADKDAKSAAGKSIAVDADKFKASVHGGMSLKCTDCHTDVSAQKLPHADKLKPVNCAACHDKAVAEYAGTVHGLARKGGNAVAASCTDCHGTHDILRAKDADSRTNHANIEATCSKCHGSDAVVAKGKLPGGNIATKFHDSIHGKALKGAAQGSAPTCNNCHGVAQHPRQGRRGEPHQPRQHPGNVRQLPQAGERRLPRGPARQAAAGRQHGGAGLHRLPLGARHPAARIGQVPGRRDRGMRHVPLGLPEDLPRHVPRTGDGARVCAHGHLRFLPRRARRAAGVESGVEGVAAEPAEDVPAVPRRRIGQLRELRPAREPARQGTQPALLLRRPVHGAAALRRVRVLRHSYAVLVLPRGREKFTRTRPAADSGNHGEKH